MPDRRTVGRAFPADFEVTNVCLTKMRRQPASSARRAAFRLAARLQVDALAVDQAAVLELAEITGLTAYDASYLWLARSSNGELTTLDRELAAVSP